MNTRIEHYDGDQVVYIALDPAGVWARSEFPQETVTVDYDEDGRPIGIEVVGEEAKNAAAKVRNIVEQFVPSLVEQLQA